jgi:hypothetical protein
LTAVVDIEQRCRDVNWDTRFNFPEAKPGKRNLGTTSIHADTTTLFNHQGAATRNQTETMIQNHDLGYRGIRCAVSVAHFPRSKKECDSYVYHC